MAVRVLETLHLLQNAFKATVSLIESCKQNKNFEKQRKLQESSDSVIMKQKLVLPWPQEKHLNGFDTISWRWGTFPEGGILKRRVKYAYMLVKHVVAVF